MMKKKIFIFIFSVAFAGAASAQGKLPNATCPVMQGEQVKKKFHATWNNQEVYFCCRSCVKRFKKDPEKYAGNL